MLRLIRARYLIKLIIEDLNTSHVKVNHDGCGQGGTIWLDLNTSHVKVNRKYMSKNKGGRPI